MATAAIVMILIISLSLSLSTTTSGMRGRPTAISTGVTEDSTGQNRSADHYSHKDIAVTQSKSGEKVNGQPEYEVDVFNGSPCTQSNITMYCQGFRTLEKVNPYILKKIGNGTLCLVFQGQPILPFQGKGVSFMYAWPQPFPFRTVSSNVYDCS